VLTKFFRSGDEVVTVIAGSGPETTRKFIIHKEFACSHSPVLNAAFNGGFIEGQTQTYELKDTEGEVMQLLTRWLYTQTVPFELIPRGAEGFNEKFFRNTYSAVRLWVLADMLLIIQLQNDISDYILAQHGKGRVATHCVKYVFGNTLAGSPLRQLFVMICALYCVDDAYKSNPQRYPPEFFQEFVEFFSKHREVAIDHLTVKKEEFHVRARPPS